MSHVMRQVMPLVVHVMHHVVRHVKRHVTRQPARPPIHLPALLLALATLAGCATAPPVVPSVVPPVVQPVLPPVLPPNTLAASAPARSPAAAALHTLFDTSWDAAMQRHPEWATYVGDNRWGDQLLDASPEAEAADYASCRRRLAAAQAIDRSALDARDRSSLDLFIHGQQQQLSFEPMVSYRRMSMAALGGFHTDLADLLQASPVTNPAQAEQALARLAAWPRRVDQELVRLRQGLAQGWVPPRPVIARVLSAIDRQIAAAGDRPALDGSRPGWFNANAQGYKTRPTWAMEALTAHEAVPGHHLQSARAIELGALPRFRRSSGYVAYAEGWALYAETLGFELGLYKDPASRFGYLQFQIWRAARLVVDTGLHDQGWSRDRAIDYMVAQTGRDRGFMASEVDRYTSDPAQALGYMIGQLKIIELRDRARAALGDRFDIRRFHMVLLDQGAVPLTLLERQVDDWIASIAATR